MKEQSIFVLYNAFLSFYVFFEKENVEILTPKQNAGTRPVGVGPA